MKSQPFLRCLIALLSSIATSTCPAQDDVAQRFIEVCNRIEANRSRVLTYAVKINAAWNSTDRFENGKTDGHLWINRYQIIADHTHDSMLILVSVRDLRDIINPTSTCFYIKNSEGEFHDIGFGLKPIDRTTRFGLFVDPMLMGLTLGRFAGEGTGPLADKLRAMRRSADLQYYRTYTDTEGLLTFYKEPAERNIAPAKQESRSFDNLREFEPVEYRSKEGKDPNDFHRIQTESTEVEGIYLPTRSYSKIGPSHMLFELDWVFVNRPIPPSLFDPEVVGTLLNPPVPADGNPATFDEPFFQDLLR
jgi:hypothetical protein